jgi:hypothetical protein
MTIDEFKHLAPGFIAVDLSGLALARKLIQSSPRPQQRATWRMSARRH